MNLSNQFLQGYALIEIIAVFMLLLMFLLEGGGAISLDRHYYFRKGDDLMLSDN
jgi:hypothetical protein